MASAAARINQRKPTVYSLVLHRLSRNYAKKSRSLPPPQHRQRIYTRMAVAVIFRMSLRALGGDLDEPTTEASKTHAALRRTMLFSLAHCYSQRQGSCNGMSRDRFSLLVSSRGAQRTSCNRDGLYRLQQYRWILYFYWLLVVYYRESVSGAYVPQPPAPPLSLCLSLPVSIYVSLCVSLCLHDSLSASIIFSYPPPCLTARCTQYLCQYMYCGIMSLAYLVTMLFNIKPRGVLFKNVNLQSPTRATSVEQRRPHAGNPVHKKNRGY